MKSWLRWGLAGAGVLSVVAATSAQQTYILTTNSIVPSNYETDGIYSQQPAAVAPLTATTNWPGGYTNTSSGQPLIGGQSMNGATQVTSQAYLVYCSDCDGRPLQGQVLTYPGHNTGYVSYTYPVTISLFGGGQKGFVSADPAGINIDTGLVAGNTYWGGTFAFEGGEFSDPQYYGAGSFQGGIIRQHTPTNAGNIRIIVKDNGAYVNVPILAFPITGSNACYFSDVSNGSTGCTWDYLPGGTSQQFLIEGKTFLLPIPNNGYTVYTITDGVVSGGASTIGVTPSSVVQGTTNTWTFVNQGSTAWDGSTQFAIQGSSNSRLTGFQSRSSDYQTVVVTGYSGDAPGTLTVIDSVDSSTGKITVTSNSSPTPSPTATPSASPSPVSSPTPSPSPGSSPTPAPTPCPSGETCKTTQPVDTTGFWQSLFVPTQTHFSDFDALRAKFAGWGPAGYITAFLAAWNTSETYCSDCACSPTLDFSFDLGTWGHVAAKLPLSCTQSHTKQDPNLGGSAVGDLILTVRPYMGYGVDLFCTVGLIKLLWPRAKA